MPITVSPTFEWPPESDPVVSPDGRITAIADVEHAGVLLRADYSDDPAVSQVRFERGDGIVVRSGNPAWAPGGWAHAYDHEAPLGVPVQWRAIPIHFDGGESTPSDYVNAFLPPVSDGYVWLKPADPNLALMVRIEPMDFAYDGRVDSSSIAGSQLPAATWDVLQGHTSEIRLLVRDRDTEDLLMAVLDAGPVLVQLPLCAGVKDFWFIRDKVQIEQVHWDGYPWRRFQIPTIPTRRPATTDTELFIPGLSYDTVARDWASYDSLAAQVASYNRLLEG